MKRKLLILLIALLTLSICFTACSGNEEEGIETIDSGVKSIEVDAKSVPTHVNLGETPDFSGIKVTVNYIDGTTKEVGFADVKIGKLDTTTTGSKFVTVTYANTSTKVEIIVVDPEVAASVTGIKIVPGSMPTSCFLAHALDISKLQVEATYDNGRANDALSVSEYTYTNIDTSKPGEKTFTVTYKANPALTDSITIKVLDIVNMIPEGNSIGSKIFVGETLDTSKLIVAVYYEDGTSEIVNRADVTVGKIDSTTPGTKKLAISYNGFSIEWNVVVVGTSSLEVLGCPSYLFYGDTLDLSAVTAYLKYTDGTESEEIAKSALKFGTIDNKLVGGQQLKVSYKDVETYLTIKVVGVESLTVKGGTLKNEILKGTAYDTSKLVVDVKYTDEKYSTAQNLPATIDARKLTLGTIDVNKVGEQTLTIEYFNKTINYTVTVCEIESIVAEDIIVTGASVGTVKVNLDGMTVKGIYGTGNEIVLTEGISTNLADLDLNTVGEKKLEIYYNGAYGSFKTEQTISVIDAKLTEIEISDYDEYVGVGQTYNTSSIKVLAKYDNNTKKEITEGFVVSEIATGVAGDVTFTVTYTEGVIEKTATGTVAVLPVTDIDVSGLANKIFVYDAFDTNGVKVVVTFGEGENAITAIFEGEAVTVSDLDANTAGVQTLTVSCGGQETTFDVNVVGVKSLVVVSGAASEILKGNGGKEYDTSAIKVNVTYTDNNTDVLEASELKLGKIKVNEAGEQSLTVEYLDKTITYNVKVCEVVRIEVQGVPKTYVEGMDVNLSDLMVFEVYNDSNGTKFVLDESEYQVEVSAPDADNNKTVTVTYGSITAQKRVGVTEPKLIKIEVVYSNKYVGVGQIYDTTKITVNATYENGNLEEGIKEGFTVSEIATDEARDVTFTVTYEGMTAEGTVTVLPVTNISVSGLKSKIFVGGEFNTTNVEVTVTFGDGTKMPAAFFEVADVTVSELDANTATKQTLTLNFGGYNTTFDVTVVGVESLEVVSGAAKEILKGNAYDTSAIRVKVTYTDGTTATLGADKLNIVNIDENKAGEQNLTITVLDKTIEYAVKVCEVVRIEVQDVPSQIFTGDTIDTDKITVNVVYNDTKGTKRPVTDYNVGSIDTSVAGVKTLTVSYDGVYGKFEATIEITVKDPAVTSIKINDGYDKFVGLGQSYNTSNITVNATYENGDVKTITTGFTTEISTATAGNATLKVTYEGITAEVTVNVLPIESIQISDIATQVDKGATLDTSKATITVFFSDGSNTTSVEFAASDVKDVKISTPNTTIGGDKNLTVEYLGFTTTFAYHVKYVTGIEIVGGTISSEIRDGYGLDDSSLMIRIFYSTGDQDTVRRNAKEIGAKTTGTGKGSTKFTVTYEGCTAEMALTPISIFVDPTGVIQTITALNGTVPAEVRQGSTLDYNALRLSVTYYKIVDDNVQLFVYLVGIDDPYLTITNIDTSTTGTKAITFTYECGGYKGSTTVNIEVLGVKPAEEGGVEIVSGILPFVAQNGTINTDNISIKVTYTNGFYTYIGKGANGLTFDEYSTASVGKITFTARVFGVPATKEIEVIAPQTADGIIFGTLLPDELVARESYKKNFKDQSSAYRVGDDNPYYFNLNVISLDDNDNIIEVDGSKVSTTAKIYLDGAEIGTSNQYVTFDPRNNSYDFTEAAIGKTFTIKVWPQGEVYESDDSMMQKHTVTVVDGYNIYNAWELNVMTNCSNNIMKAIDGAPALYQKDVATEFLRKRGVTRPETLGGIVLHCNLNVTENDIPAEYVCHYTRNGVEEKGLYDQLGIFHRELSTSQKTFAIYGNYYSVYSYEISPVAHKGFGGNPDEFSSSDLFKIRASESVYGSLDLNIKESQTVFDAYQVNIQDISTRDNDPNSNDQAASERHMRGIICYKLGACVANVTNINIEAYQTSMLVEDANTTLNLNKSNLYNAWQGHLFLWNDNYVQYVLQGDSTSKNTTTAAYARDVIVNITDSSLTKCGGPVIISQSTKTEYACNNASGAQVHVSGNSELHTYVTGQEAWFVAVGQTQLAAQIKAMNNLIMKCNNNDMSTYYGSHGYLSTDYISGVPTVNMIMVNMGTSLVFDGSESFNGYFEKNGEVAMRMSNGKHDRELYNNTALDTYVAATKSLNQKGEPAPVFQSSGGGIAFTDGSTGCYGIDFTKENPKDMMCAPATNFYGGKFVSLYYMGVGIVMEYYHPKAQ